MKLSNREVLAAMVKTKAVKREGKGNTTEGNKLLGSITGRVSNAQSPNRYGRKVRNRKSKPG